MKAKIRKTGEIVDVIAYSGTTDRDNNSDYVSFIDSSGIEHRMLGNYYWDFEPVDNIDWEQVRINAAIVATQGFLSNPDKTMVNASLQTIAQWAVTQANMLVEELKKQK